MHSAPLPMHSLPATPPGPYALGVPPLLITRFSCSRPSFFPAAWLCSAHAISYFARARSNYFSNQRISTANKARDKGALLAGQSKCGTARRRDGEGLAAAARTSPGLGWCMRAFAFLHLPRLLRRRVCRPQAQSLDAAARRALAGRAASCRRLSCRHCWRQGPGSTDARRQRRASRACCLRRAGRWAVGEAAHRAGCCGGGAAACRQRIICAHAAAARRLDGRLHVAGMRCACEAAITAGRAAGGRKLAADKAGCRIKRACRRSCIAASAPLRRAQVRRCLQPLLPLVQLELKPLANVLALRPCCD